MLHENIHEGTPASEASLYVPGPELDLISDDEVNHIIDTLLHGLEMLYWHWA